MGDSAARFKAEVLRRLDTVLDGQEDALHQAATIFANTIERGGIIRAFGSGHSHANALEICGRAGGYIQTKVVREPAWGIYEMIDGVGDQFWLKLDLRPEDCLVVISNSGRNPLPIELAQHAQEAGVPYMLTSSRMVLMYLGDTFSASIKSAMTLLSLGSMRSFLFRCFLSFVVSVYKGPRRFSDAPCSTAGFVILLACRQAGCVVFRAIGAAWRPKTPKDRWARPRVGWQGRRARAG